MPSTRAALNEALEAHRRWTTALHGLHDGTGAASAQILNQYAQDLIALIARASNAKGAAIPTREDVLAIMREADGALTRAIGTHSRLLDRALPKMIAGEARRMRAYSSFGRATIGNINAAAKAFTPEARAIFNDGFRVWTDHFQGDGKRLISEMRKAVSEAALNGYDQRALANRLLRIPQFNFGNLPPLTDRGKALFSMGGRLGESDALVRRAHLIARTETTAIQNTMHIRWTKEAGFTHYVNINPLDDRTSVGCREASAESAKTLEEWESWTASDGQGGKPPRRPNCRSQFFAVPRGMEDANGLPEEIAQAA